MFYCFTSVFTVLSVLTVWRIKPGDYDDDDDDDDH